MADSEEIMLDALKVLLLSAGYKVDLAKTGEKGLEISIRTARMTLCYRTFRYRGTTDWHA